jgi:beta-phosphoglucomutase
MIDYTQFGFIFDMDGTLVDNMRFHTLAWQRMLDENGITARADTFLVNTAGKTNREIIPTIFPSASFDEISRLADRKEAIYRELYGPLRTPLAGAVEFLSAAKQCGIRMAVATAAPPPNVEFILDGLDLRQYFDAVTTAADISHGKPDPEIFLASVEKLAVQVENCIVFEDALNGFEAAERASMKSIGLATVNSLETIIGLPSVVAAYRTFFGIRPQEMIMSHILESAVSDY